MNVRIKKCDKCKNQINENNEFEANLNLLRRHAAKRIWLYASLI